MENFYLLHSCDHTKFRLYINFGNSDVTKKFTELNRDKRQTNKFTLVVEAIKNNVANKSQFNYEGKCDMGDIYAIKVDNHRFYSVYCTNFGYRELFMFRYGSKQSQSNTKKLTDTIESISKVTIQKLLE